MKFKKTLAAAVAAAALFAVAPGVANAAGVDSADGNTPSSDGVVNNYPSYEYQVPDHAPSFGYADGAHSAPVSLGGGVTVVVIGHGGDIQAPKITDAQASNTVLNDGWTAPAAKSLVANPTRNLAKTPGATSATLVFNFGDKYEGADVKVFAQHGQNGNEGTDVYYGTKVSGKISTVEVSKFSTFTVAVKGGKGGANTGAKSPQTGVALADIADYVADLF